MSKRSNRRQRRPQKRIAGAASLAALRKLARMASPSPEAARYLTENAAGWRGVLEHARKLADHPNIPRKLRTKLRRRLPQAEEALEAALATVRLTRPEPGEYVRELLLSGAHVGKSRRAPPVVYFDETPEFDIPDGAELAVSIDGGPAERIRVVGTPRRPK